MKRIVAIILVVVMMTCLTGCAALKEKAQQRLEEQLAALPEGTVKGNVYSCQEAGISFVKPADWRFLSDEEITVGLELEESTDPVKYDMYALGLDEVEESVAVVYQDINSGNGKALLEKTYIRIMQTQLEDALGVDAEMSAPKEVTLGEKSYQTVNGYTKDRAAAVYFRLDGSYSVMIVIHAEHQQALTELEARFGKEALKAEEENAGTLPFARGKYEGNTYKNEFSGITFEKPDGWDYMSSSELANEMGLSGNALTDENVAATYTQEGFIYDTYALSPDGGSVIIYYENALGGDEQDYIESIKLELQADEEVTYSEIKLGTCTLSGAQYRSAATIGEYDGVKLCQTYYLREVDGVMCVVIITALNESELADTEACFK